MEASFLVVLNGLSGARGVSLIDDFLSFFLSCLSSSNDLFSLVSFCSIQFLSFSSLCMRVAGDGVSLSLGIRGVLQSRHRFCLSVFYHHSEYRSP